MNVKLRSNSTLLFGLISMGLGVMLDIQSRANSVLANQMHSSIAAGLACQLAAWVFIIPIYVFNKDARSSFARILPAIKSRSLAWWEMLGGVFGGSFLTIQSYSVPLVGVALFTIALIAGQTMGSLFVDKTRLSPSGKHPITLQRFLAALITLVSVLISVYPELHHSTFHYLPFVLTFIGGIFLAMGQGVNGRAGNVLKNTFSVTFIAFVFATLVLVIGLTINVINSHPHITLSSNFWAYLGGPAGLIYVAVSALIVKHIGVLKVVLFIVAGQLIGALAIDWLMPTKNTSINGYVIVGTITTFTSLIVANYNGNKKRATV
jgi:transporter family-2 protein